MSYCLREIRRYCCWYVNQIFATQTEWRNIQSKQTYSCRQIATRLPIAYTGEDLVVVSFSCILSISTPQCCYMLNHCKLYQRLLSCPMYQIQVEISIRKPQVILKVCILITRKHRAAVLSMHLDKNVILFSGVICLDIPISAGIAYNCNNAHGLFLRSEAPSYGSKNLPNFLDMFFRRKR